MPKEEMIPMTIDLNVAKKGELNETSYGALGAQIEYMLSTMFKGGLPSGFVRGTQSQIDSFIDTMRGEKNYISSYVKYGLNDPKTFSSKYALDSAIRNFERSTGIKWPVK